jgi:hypothetical protein
MSASNSVPQAHEYLVALRNLAEATEAHAREEITSWHLELVHAQADHEWKRYELFCKAQDRQAGGWHGK